MFKGTKILAFQEKKKYVDKLTNFDGNGGYLEVIKKVLDACRYFKVELNHKDFYIVGSRIKLTFIGGLSIDEITKLLRGCDLGTNVTLVVREFSSTNRDNEFGFMKALTKIGFKNCFGSYNYLFT